MSNLQDLIKLAKADGGKFFVMDEAGEAKLVIMSVDDYEKLLLGKLGRQVKEQTEDIEKINKEIIKAQLQETEKPVAVEVLRHVPEVPEPPMPSGTWPRPKTLGPTIMEQPSVPQVLRQDLRAEVIDPSFDFEGPKVEIDDL